MRPKRRKRKNAVPHCTFNTPSLEETLALHRQGDQEKAKHAYCQILAREPANADAWHLLGMLLHATGHSTDAVECIENAAVITPKRADILSNLGMVYRALGRLRKSAAVLERAVSLDPQSVATRNNLGTVLMESGCLGEAEASFQTALQIDPTSTDAAMNLGNVWQRQGRLNDAEQLYRRCLDREPSNALVLTNLGEALRRQCRWADAADVLQKAVQQNPNLIETQLNFGRTLMNSHQLDAAEAHFRELLSLYPDDSRVHHFLGNALSHQSKFEAALASLRRSLELNPGDAYTHNSLAFLLMDASDHQRAAEHFRESVRLDPAMSQSHSALLFLMSGDPSVSQQELFDEHVQWAKMHGQVRTLGPHCNLRQKNRRLRIGYVSPDFRNHAVAFFFQPVIDAHNADAVEVYCYAEVANPDATTQRMRERVDQWRYTTGMSDLQVAEQIVADKIDILIDLAGHTANNRLVVFAHKPAPIQVTWLGYPNTTGLSAIDYRLSCNTVHPKEEENYHTEKLIRMPTAAFCFSQPAQSLEIKSPPVQKNGYITFGSLHRPFKISQNTCNLWSSLLHACPTARLLAFNTAFTAESEAGLIESLANNGIDPKRIEVRRQFVGESYLATYDDIDIALDVSPWAGGTTTLEALWSGVPVIARYGDRGSARSSASVVTSIGRSEWIARSDADYLNQVISLANDIPQLCRHRRQLREQMQKTVFDGKRFTRDLERVYGELWNHWCDQETLD
jgi:predicted O-linked N-acetylglucosamine transferase (SPINDLY family)